MRYVTLLLCIFFLTGCMGQFAKKPPHPTPDESKEVVSQGSLPQCSSEHNVIICDWGKA